MTSTTLQRVHVQGEVFGARGCASCSCDPCDCNPCTCGDGLQPSYPFWRVSGYWMKTGTIQGIDVTGRLLLSLALPVGKNDTDAWQEVLLVDEQATQDQMKALLLLLEEDLESIPAEVNHFLRKQRTVYTVPMRYNHETEQPLLQVDFAPKQAQQVRTGMEQMPLLNAWHYHGPMALRNIFEMHT